MRKYLCSLLSDHDTTVTFNSYNPVTGQDVPRSDYEVKHTMSAGVRAFKTLKEARKWQELMRGEGASVGEIYLKN